MNYLRCVRESEKAWRWYECEGSSIVTIELMTVRREISVEERGSIQ